MTTATIADAAFLKPAVGQLNATVRFLCATDFLVFQKVELGFELGPHHVIWDEDLKSGKDVLEMAPRDHGKSHSLARAYPIWRLKYDPWVREVLILGASGANAVENLDQIKNMLNSCPSLQYLIPRTRKETFYSRTEAKLSNGKVLRARAMGSRLRGFHPQLIVLDDVVNEENSLDPDNRAILSQYYSKVVIPMKDKGLHSVRAASTDKSFQRYSQIVAVGTPQHEEDLWHEMAASGEYATHTLPAILDDEKQEVLWPDRYSYEDLMATKRRVGALVFQQEYMLRPISDETSIFPPSLFEPLKDHDLSYKDSYHGPNYSYLGVDFSVPGSADKDWTVIFALEFDPQSNTYTPINFWRQRPTSISAQLDQVEYWCSTYDPVLGYLEDNMFQRIYAEHFKNTAWPLQGHTVTHANKNSLEQGILSFRPLFENGRFRFPYKTALDQQKTDLIIQEFTGVRQKKGKIGNESTHDDIVMALWHAYRASKEGTTFNVSW